MSDIDEAAPQLPKGLSTSKDGLPIGQEAKNREAHVTIEVERMLQDRFPAIKWLGTDSIDSKNEAAAQVHFAAYFSRPGWTDVEVVAEPSNGTLRGWQHGSKVFVVQFFAPYPDGKLKLVEYYGVGFVKKP